MDKSMLDYVEGMVDQLSADEQAQLLASLARRMDEAANPGSDSAPLSPEDTDKAWECFFMLGDGLTASGELSSESLTSALLAMRR